MSLGDKLEEDRDTGMDSETLVRSVVRQASQAQGDSTRWLLAVSGGIDSMVLLDAFARVAQSSAVEAGERSTGTIAPGSVYVATFDHGTGPAATAAAELVNVTARALGVPCLIGKADHPGRTEAEWRHARWKFLRTSAHEIGAAVVTAHTQTDQIETVFMRILRDAGPRGIAALYAQSDIVRPFLTIPRSTITAYADARNITYISDPSNVNTIHLRNRIRNELLPRIRTVDPDFESDLLTLSARAADWRTQMDHIAANFTVMTDATNSVHVPREQFSGYSEAALRVLWPAVIARAGIVMDWRGTHRLAAFTIVGDPGQSIQLSGGIHVRLRRNALVFTRPGSGPSTRSSQHSGRSDG